MCASRAQLNSSWGASPPNARIPIRPFRPPSCHPSVCVSVGLHVYLNNNIVMFLVTSICVAMKSMFISFSIMLSVLLCCLYINCGLMLSDAVSLYVSDYLYHCNYYYHYD